MPSRTSSPSSHVMFSSISRNCGPSGNMVDTASVLELISSANCVTPAQRRITAQAHITGMPLIGLPSGGPEAPSPPKLSPTKHFTAAADAHRPATSLLHGTSTPAPSHSRAWWIATQLTLAQQVRLLSRSCGEPLPVNAVTGALCCFLG